MTSKIIKLFFMFCTTFLAYSMNQNPESLKDICTAHLIKNNRLNETQEANIPQELKIYIKESLKENTELLFKGIWNSNVDRVKRTIKNGANINDKERDSESARGRH